ncbi:MAG: ABC transporter substrate-binding protein [Oscillospiraceae bacterium]|jgi:NitT/TauT family transport system substrate-binding protein|nr:ABC transporter substrate-binding protein [Oscillospiraceae bacterium]
MKKAISVAALLLAVLLVFSACATGGTTTTSPTPTPASTPTDSGAATTPTPEVPTPAPLEQTTFALGHLNSTAHLLGFVAEQEGFFAEEGLTVTLTLFASAGELVAGLESGKLDAAFIGSVPVVTQQSAGHDITVFGGAMSNGHGYVLKSEFIPEGFQEGDITVLKGRNVASVKNSVQDLELLVLLKNNGIEIGEGADKVNIIYFDSQKDAYNALAGAQIDAASVYSPYASIAKNAGHTVVYYCNEAEEFHNQPCCRQVALTTALAAKPNTYIAFERALIKAFKFSQENHAQTVADVGKYITIDAADIEYEVYGGHAQSHPDPDRIATFALKEDTVAFGYTADYDITQLYNVDIYSRALNSLLAENPNDSVYKELLAYFTTAD